MLFIVCIVLFEYSCILYCFLHFVLCVAFVLLFCILYRIVCIVFCIVFPVLYFMYCIVWSIGWYALCCIVRIVIHLVL